ncbi:MFS transporter [Candidatus Bathyarchaeota archaeon]|nr:MFS transporter [Candidatus Bathyarchaeota archaeon]
MVFSTVTSPLVIISSRMFGLAGGIVWLVVTNLVLVVVSFLLSGSKVKEQKIRRKDLDGIGRSFFMYFLAWALISLYNGFFSPVLDTYAGSFQDLAQLSFILKYVTVGAAALIGGFIMDRHGRKPVLLLGVVLLGLAASLYAVSPSSPTFVLIWAISGGSWGLFLPAFYLLIWAEAAPGEVKAFAYAFGLMVFHLMRSLGFLVYPYLSQFKPIELALISSSVFFLVALSLTFAKETLPLQDRQAIRLSRYMRKAVEEVERA